MADEYGADDDLIAAMAASNPAQPARRVVQQPTPQRLQQPIPQRMDKAPPSRASTSGNKVVQPTPQALPQKQTATTIMVSPRQRGNPVLACFKTTAWEYSDIPADYVVGLTTCALFLSLKYHRLHPEYIYTRVRNLQGKYNLRIILTMVDIPNHEDSLRELSKTSMVNNATILLCWSAAEAAHYLELYKSYENASFSAIRGQQPSTYADKLVDFVTVPRSLNKSDAVAMVANFGSLRNAINADQEQLGMIGGWGGVKVKRWTNAVEEPFRARKAAKRGLQKTASTAGGDGINVQSSEWDRTSLLEKAVPLSRIPLREMSSVGQSERESPAGGAPRDIPAPQTSAAEQFHFLDEELSDDDEDAEAIQLAASAALESDHGGHKRPAAAADHGGSEATEATLSGGVAAALAKLREK